MAEFRQHIPSFCEGFERKIFQFNTFEELMSFQKDLLPNDKWCYSDYVDNNQLLMVETIDNKSWYVIGYVEGFDLSKYLPKVVYEYTMEEDYKERCKDCAYLVEKDNKWYCDPQYQYCEDISICHEV